MNIYIYHLLQLILFVVSFLFLYLKLIDIALLFSFINVIITVYFECD